MPPVGFEPTISVGERPQTYALDRKTTGTGSLEVEPLIEILFSPSSLYNPPPPICPQWKCKYSAFRQSTLFIHIYMFI